MTSVPDGQNQDYRRLLALRTSGATPPPSERFLPIAPAPPPANVQQQPQQQPQPSSASAQGAASNGLITSVGEAYMRRDAPPPSSSYHYRLPPHVAAAYQTQNYDCGASSSSSGSGRSLPHVPADYLSASHYHPAAHSSHYHHPHYNTISHPSHHHGSLHHQHPHHRSPHHHHPDYRRHLSTSQCPGASYLRHSSRSARLEELLNSAAAASNRVPSPRLPPTPSTPRTTPPLQTRSLPSNDSLVDAPALDTRATRRYQQQQVVLEQQQQQQQQSNSRLYQDPSPVPSQQSSRSYQSQQQQQQQSQEPTSSLTGAVQPSRPESRCSISSVAGSASALPLAWRNAVSSAAAAASASVPPCTPPGTSPSGQATPASPSSSSSPSASATSSTASCSSQTCSSVSSVSSAASTIPATTTSSLAPSPPQNPTITPPVPSSPIESTTADTPRVARAVTRTETIKNYIKRGTAEFFGLCENDEDEERLRLRWLERRKRLAVRKCGPLREECAPVAARHAPARQRAAQVASRPDVLPTDSPDHPGSSSAEPEGPRWTEPPVRRKESVARMALGGLGYVITTLTRHRARATSRSREWSRSYSPTAALDPPQQQQQPATPPRLFQDEVFFDKPASISGASGEGDSGGNKAQEEKASSASNLHTAASEPSFRSGQQSGASESLQDDPDHRPIRDHRSFSSDRAHSWRRSRQEPGAEATSPEVGASRIWSHVLDRALDNSDRRQYGMGFVGRMLSRRSRKRSVVHRHKRQLDDMEDYRPFFTYWVTTVHVMVMALSLLCYGLGPLGIDLNQRSSLVMVPSLSLQQVDYLEPANFWIGPRAADLIHLGAKFSPCMRKDHRIWRRINKAREKERETACCIRNDDSGCVQSSQAECSLRGLRPTQTISTWKKWSAGESGPGGRISGSVCGLDPKYCELPASIAPFEWPDDITKWPICRKPSSVVQRRGVNGVGTQLRRDKTAEHMVCEVIAHPCCIGIHGSCSITTKEYCDFVRGKFHEEASLCSQVSCLDDVCGMIPFYNPDRPDQFYRLWTSLFLHAGFVHLLLTLVVQLCIMRDVERMTGPLRMAMIYLGSGMGGNLASAIFVPYRAEVGPAGAQFGLLACLMVEVLDVWPMLRRPEQALLKLLAVVALLLLLGLLPWVDNWAHVFGFVFGLLLSSALLPFVTIGSAPFSRHRKRLQVWLCLGGAMLLFLALVAIFYLVPVIDCPLCDLFNCLPITSQFCAEQDINFGRDEIV